MNLYFQNARATPQSPKGEASHTLSLVRWQFPPLGGRGCAMGNPKFIEPGTKCKFKKPPKQLPLNKYYIRSLR